MREFLKQIIKDGGAIAKDYFYKGVTFKIKSHLNDVVTEADVACEKFFIEKILAKYPDHAIHSEEMKADINPGAQFEWVIDPLDGTYNFSKGVSIWCHLIAVQQNGETIMAAAYNPIADELFFAVKGQGATMNGMPIRVNSKDSLDYSAGTVMRSFTDSNGFLDVNTKLLRDYKTYMCNFGTMFTACYLASGGQDFFITNGGFDHDYTAPAFICSEAGALVTNAKGEPWRRGMSDIVIANSKLHPKVLELFK